MHRAFSSLALGLSALLPAAAMASPLTGFPAVPDCSATVSNIDSDHAELYVVKLTPSATQRQNDWLWNVERKGEANSDAQSLLDNGGFYSCGDVWGIAQGAPDVAFAFITFANGDIYVDNNDGSSVDWGVAPVQTVGDSLMLARDAGIGLVVPGTATQFPVKLTPASAPKSFPIAGLGAPNIAFSPVAEVNPNDAVTGICQIAGQSFNPRDPTRGVIIGYNVYRLPGSAANPPTRADFMNAIRTDDDTDGGWVYFMDLRKFDVTLADINPPGPTPGTNDLDRTDLAGIQNPDGRMYSGDEVLILQDSAGNMGAPLRPRAVDLAGHPGVSYWYAVQPVVVGNIGEFASADFTVNGLFAGDHRIDLDNDGEFDAVSLDSTVAGGHDTPEFISPQGEAENGSQDGMGLTNGGEPLLSKPMFVDSGWSLPAHGRVELTASVRGSQVSVRLTTGLEASSVRGYDVYRIEGGERVLVNDQPILAKGLESNVYALTDVASRTRGARMAEYVVETLYTDGSVPTVDGPFTVPLLPEAARRKR